MKKRTRTRPPAARRKTEDRSADGEKGRDRRDRSALEKGEPRKAVEKKHRQTEGQRTPSGRGAERTERFRDRARKPAETGRRDAAQPSARIGNRAPGTRETHRNGGVKKTLDRILSRAGAGSRTVSAEWIKAGRVRVNGKAVRDPEHWVDPESDRVSLDGRTLRPQDRLYILLYKPKGYLCTREDPQNRPTIYDLLKDVKSWVFNVGRLDQDTSGLLILTNDTELGEVLTNPEYKVPKTYLVKASTRLTDEQLDRLRHGVMLSDGPTQPAEVIRLRDSEKYTHLAIVIREGRNRQVRRMLEAVDSKVLKLVRTHIGDITIGNLEIGKHRPLQNDEVQALKRIAMGEGRSAAPARRRAADDTRDASSERWSERAED